MSCLATTTNTRLAQWWVYLFLDRNRDVVLFTIFTINIVHSPPLRQARERYMPFLKKNLQKRNSHTKNWYI